VHDLRVINEGLKQQMHEMEANLHANFDRQKKLQDSEIDSLIQK